MATIYKTNDHQEVLASPLALKCFNNKEFEIILLSLKKGESIPMHKNPYDVLFYVISGKGTLTIEHENTELDKNELAYVQKEEDRSWINNDEEILELMVIKMIYKS